VEGAEGSLSARQSRQEKEGRWSPHERLREIILNECPDELLIGPLAGLRGKKLVIVDAIAYRMIFDTLTSAVPKFGIEVLNRVGGRVPYVHDQDKDRDSGLAGLTPTQIRNESLKMLKTLKDLVAAEKKAKKREVVSEPETPLEPEVPQPATIVSEPESE